MEGVMHARRTDPRVGEWLAAADPEDAVVSGPMCGWCGGLMTG